MRIVVHSENARTGTRRLTGVKLKNGIGVMVHSQGIRLIFQGLGGSPATPGYHLIGLELESVSPAEAATWRADSSHFLPGFFVFAKTAFGAFWGGARHGGGAARRTASRDGAPQFGALRWQRNAPGSTLPACQSAPLFSPQWPGGATRTAWGTAVRRICARRRTVTRGRPRGARTAVRPKQAAREVRPRRAAAARRGSPGGGARTAPAPTSSGVRNVPRGATVHRIRVGAIRLLRLPAAQKATPPFSVRLRAAHIS
jgi:hypothetical protein